MLLALEVATVVPAGGRSRAVTTSVTVLFLQKPVVLSQRLLISVCGLVLSMLMSGTVALAVLPALSVAVPLALWVVPSLSSTASPAQPPSGIPDSRSLQVKRTRTALLNHLTWLPTGPTVASGLRAVPSSLTVLPLMAGGVRSILMPLTEAGAETLPALSAMVAGPAPRLAPSPVIRLSAGRGGGGGRPPPAPAVPA